jgi:membrane protease YdiL (CAAX protease family)
VLGRVQSIARILGALGFVLVVLGWFPLHDYAEPQETELFLAAREHREVEVSVMGQVVVNGWIRPGWMPESGDYGEIRALDSIGEEVGGGRGYGPFSLEGGIRRLAIRSGDAPVQLTIRVLHEERATQILWSERALQALGALLLIPFLSLFVVLLSPWMARDRSTHRLRRRTGWIGVAIVGSHVLYVVFHAVLSRIEGRYSVAPVVNSLGFLSWSAGLWVDVVVILALARLEWRAIGGRLLELRMSFRAVLFAILAVAAGWCSWRVLASLAPDSWAGPYRVDSTGDFPGAVLLALSAGICEEVVFRGFLMTRLRELTGRTVVPLLATSVAFGLVHVYVSGLHALWAGAFGLILGIVTLGSRNLFPAILAHVAWDLLWTVALTFDAVRGLA